ncbi:MAG: peptidylprolyl isomerase [Halothiobacillaceae bacterium]
MNKILPGCRVKMAFKLSLLDGTEIDAASLDAPMELLVGDGSISPGLEFALQGMSAGESGRFDIPPGFAFPLPDESKKIVMPPEDWSGEALPEVGQFIEFALPNGESTIARVLAASEQGLELDFNHPLAGLPLVFEVQVLEVQCG